MNDKKLTGENSQPLDHDWLEYDDDDLLDEIAELALRAGWQNLGHFKEILFWALTSPQGVRAAASIQIGVEQDPTNPWLEPFALLSKLYETVNHASHEMLREQAKALKYSKELTESLEETLQWLPTSEASLMV